MLNKNDVIDLAITDISFEGMGIGKYENMVVFVPNVALSELVQVKIVKTQKNYCFAILLEIITPSKERIHNDCNEKCGGCTYRHISYKEELLYKALRINNAFKKANLDAVDVKVAPAHSMLNYRNKIQLPITTDQEGNLITGFYAKNSHRVVKMNHCKIQNIYFNDIIEAFIKYATKYKLTAFAPESKSGLLRHVYLRCADDGIMLCIVSFSDSKLFIEIANILAKEFPNITSVFLNINNKLGNAVLGDKYIKLFRKEHLTDNLLGYDFNLSPASFYQVNKTATELLYNTGISMLNLKKTDIVVDFYCGIGTISLCLSKYAKFVYGCEIVKTATENATSNALINNIKNTEFINGDAGDVAKTLFKSSVKVTAVVVDPPRKGCSVELIETIAQMAPEKVLYISCSPESLARDIVLLKQNGYALIELKAVDMFPRTSHIECVVKLCRVEK